MTREPPNPFRSPDEHRESNRARPEMSVSHEPHFAQAEFTADESEYSAGTGRDPLDLPRSMDDGIEHGVWEEPALAAILPRVLPDSARTYATWLEHGRGATTPLKSTLVCIAIILFSGPWAILGTLFAQSMGGGQTAVSALSICLIGPLVEEIMKVSGLLWVVEKRPYLIRDGRLIMVCAIASGLFFAIIENYLYLYVYIPNPSPSTVLWRWTICVLLHVSCTAIAGWGLWRVWSRTISTGIRPQIAMASPFLVVAVSIHAIYNSSVFAWELIRSV